MALGKGSTFANDILALILTGAAIADIAENDSSGPLTNLYISLHTASPEAGTQSTNEATYSPYARQAVARSGSGWAGSAGAWDNEGVITFPACTSGSDTITHFAVGTLESGAGKVLYCGQLTAPLNVSAGITPSFAAGALDITED